jgi:hypothetical protein
VAALGFMMPSTPCSILSAHSSQVNPEMRSPGTNQARCHGRQTWHASGCTFRKLMPTITGFSGLLGMRAIKLYTGTQIVQQRYAVQTHLESKCGYTRL